MFTCFFFKHDISIPQSVLKLHVRFTHTALITGFLSYSLLSFFLRPDWPTPTLHCSPGSRSCFQPCSHLHFICDADNELLIRNISPKWKKKIQFAILQSEHGRLCSGGIFFFFSCEATIWPFRDWSLKIGSKSYQYWISKRGVTSDVRTGEDMRAYRQKPAKPNFFGKVCSCGSLKKGKSSDD